MISDAHFAGIYRLLPKPRTKQDQALLQGFNKDNEAVATKAYGILNEEGLLVGTQNHIFNNDTLIIRNDNRGQDLQDFQKAQASLAARDLLIIKAKNEKRIHDIEVVYQVKLWEVNLLEQSVGYDDQGNTYRLIIDRISDPIKSLLKKAIHPVLSKETRDKILRMGV